MKMMRECLGVPVPHPQAPVSLKPLISEQILHDFHVYFASHIASSFGSSNPHCSSPILAFLKVQ